MTDIKVEDQIINFTITKGFSNFGNTCFYNATLQSIFRCEDLMNSLKTYSGQNQLLRYLKITIEDYFLKPNVETIGPVLLLKSYQQMNSDFIRGTQSDGEECLTYFLDNFHMATKTEGINISSLFDCNLSSKLTCPICNYESESREEPEKLIALPIKNYNNFNDAFTHFLSDETLDNDNKYNCKKCVINSINSLISTISIVPEYLQKIKQLKELTEKINSTDDIPKELKKILGDQEMSEYHMDINQILSKIGVAARKKLTIRGRPKYLYVALKRFEHEWIRQLNRIKTTKIVNDILMPDAISLDEINYRMRGCIFHMGGLNGGHYVYYNMINDKWIKFDDETISSVDNANEINAIINKGYVYLYERC